LNRDGTFIALEVEVFTDAGPYVSLTPVIALIFATEASGGYAFPNLKVTTKAIATNNLPAAPLRGSDPNRSTTESNASWKRLRRIIHGTRARFGAKFSTNAERWRG